MNFVDRPVTVRVPASSANLGPGFDALGLALSLYDEVGARVVDGPTHVAITGEGAGDLPTDERHLVVRAMWATFEALGSTPPPGVELRCHNRIPQARGLGSSSAAIVAGVLLARSLVVGGAERLSDADALRLASGIEGHPDNVAACLLGGFTIAWGGAEEACAVRLTPDVRVRPVVFVPDVPGLTATARGHYPRACRMRTPRTPRVGPRCWSTRSRRRLTTCTPPPRTDCTSVTGRVAHRRRRRWSRSYARPVSPRW